MVRCAIAEAASEQKRAANSRRFAYNSGTQCRARPNKARTAIARPPYAGSATGARGSLRPRPLGGGPLLRGNTAPSVMPAASCHVRSAATGQVGVPVANPTRDLAGGLLVGLAAPMASFTPSATKSRSATVSADSNVCRPRATFWRIAVAEAVERHCGGPGLVDGLDQFGVRPGALLDLTRAWRKRLDTEFRFAFTADLDRDGKGVYAVAKTLASLCAPTQSSSSTAKTA